MQKLRFTTAENLQLSNVLSVKPGVGHHTALHDFSAAVNSAFFIFLSSWFIQLHLFLPLLQIFFIIDKVLWIWGGRGEL